MLKIGLADRTFLTLQGIRNPLIVGLLILLAGPVYADDWRISTNVSEMDDSKAVYLRVDSRVEIPDTLGFGSTRPELWIRCLENQTSVFVNWARYISTGGFDSDQTIRYRIDDQEPQTMQWDISTNFEATGLWSGGRAIPFIRKLIPATRLLVEVTPYGENTVLAEFPLSGLSDHIGELQTACNWR